MSINGKMNKGGLKALYLIDTIILCIYLLIGLISVTISGAFVVWASSFF